jgi:hypothetical protein
MTLDSWALCMGFVAEMILCKKICMDKSVFLLSQFLKDL